MKREPLFIRFANGDSNASDVIESLLSFTEDEKSKEIAEKAKLNVKDMPVFKRDFSNLLTDVIENGISQKAINYLNSYMKPSLMEFVDEKQLGRSGEKRWVTIKEEDTPWIEAIVCYNFCLFIRAFSLGSLKRCPVCLNFFSHKGKYAKYCSDTCKSKGQT